MYELISYKWDIFIYDEFHSWQFITWSNICGPYMQMRDVIKHHIYSCILVWGESYVPFFPIAIHFISVRYIGILMSLHWTCYKFQQYLPPTVNLWTIRALNPVSASSMQLLTVLFSSTEQKTAQSEGTTCKNVKKTILVIDPFAFPFLFYPFHYPFHFSQSEHSWRSHAIKFLVELLHFILRYYYLLRNHINFYGTPIMIQYYCFLRLGNWLQPK